MLNVSILNQMDVDELRNYIHKQDVVIEYYKNIIYDYETELNHTIALIDARRDRFKDTLPLNAAIAVVNDIECGLGEKYFSSPCEGEKGEVNNI